jgi:hypothetical protein
MKKALPVFLVVFPLFIYCQEEFFIDQNGFSLGAGRNLNGPAENYSIAASAFVNRSIAISAGYSQNDESSSRLVGLAFYTGAKNTKYQIKNYLGLTYGSTEDFRLVGLTFGVYKVFFPENNFPFSINGSFLAQTAFKRSGDLNNFELVPFFSFYYLQGIFAKNVIYPVVGIGGTFNINDSDVYYSGFVGINIRIPAMKKETVETQNQVD